MSDLLQKLRDWGCDIDGALPRMLDDEEFYLSLLPTVTGDENFSMLGEALREENASQAFEAAHALKGVTANMGLTPLYDLICAMVEPLRHGNAVGLMPTYEKLLAAKAHLEALEAE